MSDLIDRQAAIKTLEKRLPSDRQQAIDAADRADYTGLAVEDVKKVTDEVVKELKQLPSVQPQPVVRCKDCRYQDKGCNESESWNLCGYRPWLHVPTEDEHYCGYAERRIDEQTD